MVNGFVKMRSRNAFWLLTYLVLGISRRVLCLLELCALLSFYTGIRGEHLRAQVKLGLTVICAAHDLGVAANFID